MKAELLNALTKCETDLNGVMRRFSGDEAFYLSCLEGFLSDSTLNDLAQFIKDEAWDDAFTSAHALKGLAGNMGFVPLFHAAGELVLLIRAGKFGEVDASFARTQARYDEILSAIRAGADAAHCPPGS